MIDEDGVEVIGPITSEPNWDIAHYDDTSSSAWYMIMVQFG